MSATPNPPFIDASCGRIAQCAKRGQPPGRGSDFTSFCHPPLTQSVELYDTYQTKVADCGRRIEQVLDRLKAAAPGPAKPLSSPRNKRRGVNAPAFDVHKDLHAMLGVDLTQIHGLGRYLVLKLVAKGGTDLSARPNAKHFTSWLSLAPHKMIPGGKVLALRTRRSGNRAASLLRLAAITVGRTEAALGGVLLQGTLPSARSDQSPEAGQSARLCSYGGPCQSRSRGSFLGKWRNCWRLCPPRRIAASASDGCH